MTGMFNLIAAQPTAPADAAKAQNALVLFFIVIAVLGLAVIVLTLFIASHRARLRKVETPSEAPMRDPWREAGRRVTPLPEDEME